MADFLSDEWFSQVNETLSHAGAIPFEGVPTVGQAFADEVASGNPHVL